MYTREQLEQEVDQPVGPKGKWNPDRTAVRHGHEDGEVTLGGRRVQAKHPRARSVEIESEVPLATYEHFADRDQLVDVVRERMLVGVSTRQHRRAREPVGEEVEANARSTSKPAVSRAFVPRTRDQLWNLMNRPLADLRLAAMMLDGIELHGRTNIVALGISSEGDKLALGLWDRVSENATVAAALLADLVDAVVSVDGARDSSLHRERSGRGPSVGSTCRACCKRLPTRSDTWNRTPRFGSLCLVSEPRCCARTT